jgi:hypothetical protein
LGQTDIWLRAARFLQTVKQFLGFQNSINEIFSFFVEWDKVCLLNIQQQQLEYALRSL